MTDKEKAIVMAYTWYTMLTGDKLGIFYNYLENIMGRPISAIELADAKLCAEMQDKSKIDFIRLCEEEE